MPGQVARSLEQLGRCRFDQGIFTDAESAFRECLEFREDISADHWRTHETRSLLGLSLADVQQREEAEALLTSSYKALRKQQDKIPAHERVTCLNDAVDRVVRFYETWGKAEEATKWRAKTESVQVSKP